jgi:hypothetical protein
VKRVVTGNEHLLIGIIIGLLLNKVRVTLGPPPNPP